MGQCSTQPQNLDGLEILPGNMDGGEIIPGPEIAENEFGDMMKQQGMMQNLGEEIVYHGYQAEPVECVNAAAPDTIDAGVMIGAPAEVYAGANPHQKGPQMYNPETDGKMYDTLEEAQAALNGQANCEKPAEVVYNTNQMHGHYTNPQPVVEPVVAYNGQPVQHGYNNEQPQGYNQPKEDKSVGHVPLKGYNAYDTPQPLFAPIENTQMPNEKPVQEVTLEEQKPVTLEDGIEPEVDDAEQIQPTEEAYQSDAAEEKNAEKKKRKKKKKGSKNKSWGWF